MRLCWRQNESSYDLHLSSKYTTASHLHQKESKPYQTEAEETPQDEKPYGKGVHVTALNAGGGRQTRLAEAEEHRHWPYRQRGSVAFAERRM